MWLDVKGSTAHEIRARPDRTIDTRVITKFLFLWQGVHQKMTKDDSWNDSLKLSTTGKGGALYLTDGDTIWELFRVKLPLGDRKAIMTTEEYAQSVVVEPVKEDLLDWGIDEGTADNMMAVARHEALTM